MSIIVIDLSQLQEKKEAGDLRIKKGDLKNHCEVIN